MAPGSSYRPNQLKRPRIEDNNSEPLEARKRVARDAGHMKRNGSNLRSGSPTKNGHPRYRAPRHRAPRRHGDYDHPSTIPETSGDIQSLTHETNSPDPSSDSRPTKHTKKERQNNRSSRIHSLRKQLARGNLLRTVHQEKERELAGLLLDQQKDKVKQGAKKNLERYHFVRFVEKQKADKKLKQLRKKQAQGDSSGELEKQIHEMEVNRNYAIYAPLGQKYISIFADDPNRKGKNNPQNNPSKMKLREFKMLSEDQKEELRELMRSESDLLETRDGAVDGTGQKPPMWYEIEAAMAEGQEKLDALRDGRAGNMVDGGAQGLVVHAGGKADGKVWEDKTVKDKSSWLDEDGRIEPKDLDSDGDEDMSDGEFFEK